MEKLFPDLDLMAREYVLIQAWKKTSAYIRYHNWFADTLDVDLATADLPRFIEGLSNRIKEKRWEPQALRLVPAPKSQPWCIDSKTQYWVPEGPLPASKTRPLAHASLEDQVLATAMMLCVADRVETRQGDPTRPFQLERARKQVSSYGNRLFCDYDASTKTLANRWGSSKLYRAYFQDYRSFIARPEYVAESLSETVNGLMIIQADLKQFYDRVRPEVLQSKLQGIQEKSDDPDFFKMAEKLFDWRWHADDLEDALKYADKSGIDGFDRIALPQGLVSAGFFANVVLIDADEIFREAVGTEPVAGLVLHDICRYVDDLRLTVSASPGISPEDAITRTDGWLNGVLGVQTPNLLTSPDKARVAVFRGGEQPLIRQARKMQRIQSTISGGFDAAGGEELIQAVQGLVRSQEELSKGIDAAGLSAFTAVPDVKDETIGRFAAGRFRSTFRSLRPLLESSLPHQQGPHEKPGTEEGPFRRTRFSQADLDDEAHGFALGLIKTWMQNPSNMRLLRVAVDLWPTPQILGEVLKLFEPYLKGKRRGAARKVIFYCLSELFRAGATETGIVRDQETLPEGVDLEGYRSALSKAATAVMSSKGRRFPWYLRQQALLFLMVYDCTVAQKNMRSETGPLSKYWKMVAFLNGEDNAQRASDFAVHSVVVRRSLAKQSDAVKLVGSYLSDKRFSEIARRDLEFARELYVEKKTDISEGSLLANDLGTTSWSHPEGTRILKDLVAEKGSLNVLRNEIGVLSFVVSFLEKIVSSKAPSIITPSSVQLRYEQKQGFTFVEGVEFNAVPDGEGYRSIYTPPTWSDASNLWRFQLGFLVRFILTGRVDFSKTAKPSGWKERSQIYRPATSHWMQRLYGFYNGHDAFGDDWLPVSQFTQDLLYSLLAWPGCHITSKIEGIQNPASLLDVIKRELDNAKTAIGPASGLLMLRVPAPNPGESKKERPLRACVVQSITPQVSEISADDLTLSESGIRKKHRNHLSTILAAVEKMLEVRDTHVDQNSRLDWLILPELSVHPDDVKTHLVPFARKHRTIILAGMTYEQLIEGQPLVNSALWIIPRRIDGRGLQIAIRRQGKQNLAKLEQGFNVPVTRVGGFRPCQWLIGYDWANSGLDEALWLTAAICYDATDLNLASDLRDRSDVFAIPALNQDVGTFDQMAQALHYHMYQLVLVANNGEFGGSNAYLPQGGIYQRQVFHTHGQPQATISFLEINNIREMKERRMLGKTASKEWKYPPAGC